MEISQTLGITVSAKRVASEDLSAKTVKPDEDHVGSVVWQGPGSLQLPAERDCCAICNVELSVPVENEILMVEASSSVTLPVGVLLQPMVVPGKWVDVNHFPMFMHNESKRDTVIPIGTDGGNCVW